MEVNMLSGGIAPLIFKLGSICMWVVRQSALATLLQRKGCGFHWVGGWSWSGYFREEIVLLLLWRFESLIFQRIYPAHCTDCAAPYWFEGNTEVHIYKMRWEVWIEYVWFMTGIPGRFLWTQYFPLKFCKRNFLWWVMPNIFTWWK